MKDFKKLTILLIFLISLLANLQSRPVLAQTYDLQAESMTVSPASPEVNKTAIITVKVKNLADEFLLDFPISYQYQFTNFVLDSTVSISPMYTTIKTGDYITFTFSGSFNKLGGAGLSFSFDLIGFKNESKTDNNAIGGSVSVVGYDLTAESLSLSPDKPTANQACTITVKIKNNSTYNLVSSTGLLTSYNFPDFTITRQTEPKVTLENYLSPGSYLTYLFEGYFAKAGTKLLSFTIDNNNALTEVSETNNTVTVQAEIFSAADVDLAASSISLNKSPVLLGETVEITTTIKNTGKTSFTSTAGFTPQDILINFPNFKYEITDVKADALPVAANALAPGATYNYRYTGIFEKAGSFILTFTIDKNSQLMEANENNNSTSTLIRVYTNQTEADDFTITEQNVSFTSSTTAIVNWKTTADTTGILNYGPFSTYVYENKIESNTSQSQHILTLNNLLANTKYDYLITANRGTVQKISELAGFATPANNNLIITSPTVTVDQTSKNAKFGWATNLNATSYLYYKKKADKDYKTLTSESYTSSHQLELTGLEVSQYDYYLAGKTVIGSQTQTSPASFEIGTTVSAPSPSQTSPTEIQPVKTSETISGQASSYQVASKSLYQKLKGKIILQVQAQGQAYFVDPVKEIIFYLGRPADAFAVMRKQGLGITNNNLAKIPLGLNYLTGDDSDRDGLPDLFEQAIGTDKTKADSDSDGFNDLAELTTGFSPTVAGAKLSTDKNFANQQKGKILLQVQALGQAWYVNPNDGKRYFLGRPADAFNSMRKLGLGISNSDFNSLKK